MIRERFFICLFFAAGALFADQIRLQDGGVFNGEVLSISERQIKIKTDFAGTLDVARKTISGVTVDNPIFVRLENGEILSGKISFPEKGVVEIAASPAPVRTSLKAVRQGWVKPQDDPERVDETSSDKKDKRKWKYQTRANFSAKSGNSDDRLLGVGLTANLVSEKDKLRLDVSYNSRESNGQMSSDRRKGGARYTSYVKDPWGWYVRQELEEDRFKNLNLRSISALGVSYRQKDKNQESMELNCGVSYRYEIYRDQTDDSSNLGLDLGLNHYFGGGKQFSLHNELTMVPSVEDVANYLISQESYIDIPFANSKRWKVRFGIENDYNSQPTGGRDPLDSRYYSRLVISWN